MNRRFSKDPKVKLVSLEEFLESNDYLCKIQVDEIWDDNTKPEAGYCYYKFTPLYLIYIQYNITYVNYGTKEQEFLDSITVAIRDGKTEYELFYKKIDELGAEKKKHTPTDEVATTIAELIKAMGFLPKYHAPLSPNPKPFETYLIDTGYKTIREDLKDKYVVFDVETNGLRRANDDLLSLSVYDPTTGICYNRLLPLDLQPLVLTGFIHGITDDALANVTHITQEELDSLIDYFNLKEKVLLSFSGGNGSFDSSFVQNYCKRHGLSGFEHLHFDNIKNRFPNAPWGSSGQLSKDNLCRIFHIEGVTDKHSSHNDCILEWKLFEKIESECLFFIHQGLYKYTPEYIIPVSYLIEYPELAKYANISIPSVCGQATELFKINFPKTLLKEIRKFPTNITGVTIEHGINSYLNAEKQDNLIFLAQNKSHLHYIGSIDSCLTSIPVIPEQNGTYRAVEPEDNEYVEMVNSVTKIIIAYIRPMAEYLKEKIFTTGKIMTQELCITEDKKVLALCDLSDSKSVVEIKTFDVLCNGKCINEKVARQLYYQAKGRNTYVISIVFQEDEEMVKGLAVFLYKVELYEYDPASIIHSRKLDKFEVNILQMITKNPMITKIELVKKLSISKNHANRVSNALKELELYGYIKKENVNIKTSPWIVLRSSKDVITRFTFDGEIIHIIDYNSI